MSMRDVDHTDPNSTENTFGRLFRRGPEMTDGGESPTEESEDTEMREVSHEHADDEDRHANRVWERGAVDDTEE